MKKVYILLTHTGTILSKAIKLYTSHEYTHVSNALDEKLDRLYSFGRINPYNPFIGGFVHESINNGTFKRFQNTQARLYCLEISDYRFNRIKHIINNMNRNRGKYHFNTIGLFLVVLNIKLRRNNYFYCAEFVKYLFDQSGTDILLPEITKPADFLKLNDLTMIYQGKLKDYTLFLNKKLLI